MKIMSDAFNRAWRIIKFDDTVPPEDYHRNPTNEQVQGIIEDAIAEEPDKSGAFGGLHGICRHCGDDGPGPCESCGKDQHGISHMVGDSFICDDCLGKTCLNLRCGKPLTTEDYIRIAGSPNPQYTKDVVMDAPWEVVCGECAAKGIEGVDETGEYGCCEDCEWCMRGFVI
jgi:hypothetical protein